MDNRAAEKSRHARLIARLRQNICFISFGSDAPAPDPNIGNAAVMNAQTAQAQLKIGEDQLAWNKERYAKEAPIYEKIANQQIDSADTAKSRSDSQWSDYQNIYRPIEQRVAQEATDYGGAADQTNQAGKAIADTTAAFDANDANRQRQQFAMGVNPNDPKFAALGNQAGLARAGAAAGAGTKAATDARLLGMSMRQNVAQFGRNMPATSIAQDASALNAGNAAQGNITGATMANNAGINSAAGWYSGATDSSTASGNLGIGLYNANSANYRTNLQANAAAMGGAGNLAGTAFSAWMGKGLKDGGVVKARPRHFADGGMADARGSMKRGAGGVNVVTIILPDPAIDPTDGSEIAQCDQPADLGDGLQRQKYSSGGVVSPGARGVAIAGPGMADGGTVSKVQADMAAARGEFDKKDVDDGAAARAAATAAPANTAVGQSSYSKTEQAQRVDVRRQKYDALPEAVKRQIGPYDPKRMADGGVVKKTRKRAYAEGGLIDAQEPATVEEKSSSASASDKTRLNKKKPLEFTPNKSAFVADFEAFSNGGLARRNFEAGGQVAGPGTETSDSIPAQLSNNEAVLNAPAVRLVGEDFVNRLNAAGLAMAGRKPQTIEGQARRVA